MKRAALVLCVFTLVGFGVFAFVLRRPAVQPAAPAEHIKRVLLITIDTLRQDRLGVYGYRDQETSPNIDTWAREAVVFDHAFTVAPWTIPALASLLTGRYSVEVGAYTNSGGISPDFTTLAAIFRRAGYTTASFSTHALLVRKDSGFRRGFDLVQPDRVVPTEEGEHKMPFDHVEPLLLDWLDQHAGESFFVWVHDMDPHLPPTVGNTLIGQPGWKRYDAEVRWVDNAMGRIIMKLQALGIWEDSLVIFTADHGEAFDEHGLLGHQDVMYDEVLRIPLILHYPGMGAPQHIAEPVSLIDLFSTILDVAGLPIPAETRGESLVPLIERKRLHRLHPYLFSARYHFENGTHQVAVRDRHWKLLATVSDPKKKEKRDERRFPTWDIAADSSNLQLYQWQFDPGELTDHYDDFPALVDKLSNVLAEWQDSTEPPNTLAPELDEASREALRALGYRE